MRLLEMPNLIAKKLVQFSPVQKVQTTLYITSIILVFLMVFSFYFSSQSLSINLALKEQSAFELNSFRQINQHISLILSNFENKIWKTSTHPVVIQSFSTKYNEKNLKLLSDRYNLISSQLTSLFNKDDYLDDVIIIGKNDSICFYGNNHNLTFYCNVDGFYFSDFINNTDLTQYFSKMDTPFYYKKGAVSAKRNVYENEIYNLIDGKFVHIRTIQNIDHGIDGIIIMTLKHQFITDTLNTIAQNQTFYICDNSKDILWSNAPQNQKIDAFNQNLFLYKSGTFQSTFRNSKYTFTYDTLSPFNFYLVSQSPVESVITEFKGNMFYPILFGFLCIFYTFIVAYFFSKKLCDPINQLAGNLGANRSSLPDHVDPDGNISFKKISLRNSFILYFVVTFIIPTVFYMSSLTYIYYGIYKNRLVVHSFNTIKHVKMNVDYKLSYLDEFVKNLVFDDNIQVLQSIRRYYSISADQKSALDKLFLNFKVLNSDLLSMNLYDINGDDLYSGLDMDNFPISNLVPDFNLQMQGNENQLVYAGSFDGIYNRNTSLLFARNLRSYNNGRYFGFITASVDQTTLNDMVSKVSLGDSGYFIIMDKQGKIFAHDDENLTSSIFNDESTKQKIFGNAQGSFQLKLDKKDYYIIYNTSAAFDFKTVGIVPANEILSKVLPLIGYSLILFLIYTVFLFAISYVISSSITKPLIKLKGYMAEVENGNFDAYMSYNGKNEVGILVNQFNAMVKRLNELITENYKPDSVKASCYFLKKRHS